MTEKTILPGSRMSMFSSCRYSLRTLRIPSRLGRIAGGAAVALSFFGCVKAVASQAEKANGTSVKKPVQLSGKYKTPLLAWEIGFAFDYPINGTAKITVPEEYKHHELVPPRYEGTYNPGDKTYEGVVHCYTPVRTRLIAWSMIGLGARARLCEGVDAFDRHLWGAYEEDNYAFIGMLGSADEGHIVPEISLRTPLWHLYKISFFQLEYVYLPGSSSFSQEYKTGYHRYNIAYNPGVDNFRTGTWKVGASHLLGPRFTFVQSAKLAASVSVSIGFNTLSYKPMLGRDNFKIKYTSPQIMVGISCEEVFALYDGFF